MVHIDRIADDTPIVIMGVAYVIPCFSLTPTAIDYREPNILATMQQPSSVVHSKLQYTKPFKYTKNTQKKQVFSSNVLGRKLLHTCTSVASSPGRFFANITTGEKYCLVLIVYGRVGCDRKFNSKTCRKTIVKFNENKDK